MNLETLSKAKDAVVLAAACFILGGSEKSAEVQSDLDRTAQEIMADESFSQLSVPSAERVAGLRNCVESEFSNLVRSNGIPGLW